MVNYERVRGELCVINLELWCLWNEKKIYLDQQEMRFYFYGLSVGFRKYWKRKNGDSLFLKYGFVRFFFIFVRVGLCGARGFGGFVLEFFLCQCFFLSVLGVWEVLVGIWGSRVFWGFLGGQKDIFYEGVFFLFRSLRFQILWFYSFGLVFRVVFSLFGYQGSERYLVVVGMCVRVCVCVCMYMCMCARVCGCAYVCM